MSESNNQKRVRQALYQFRKEMTKPKCHASCLVTHEDEDKKGNDDVYVSVTWNQHQ